METTTKHEININIEVERYKGGYGSVIGRDRTGTCVFRQSGQTDSWIKNHYGVERPIPPNPLGKNEDYMTGSQLLYKNQYGGMYVYTKEPSGLWSGFGGTISFTELNYDSSRFKITKLGAKPVVLKEIG